MKKRVAVELSGYLRTFDKCYESWNNILDYDNYDYDFFVHTYTKKGITPGYHIPIDHSDDIDVNLLKSSINIKRIVIEEPFDNGVNHMVSGHSTIRVKLMYRKVFLCNKLLKDYIEETGEEYEYVIRIRPDLMFNQKLGIPVPQEKTIIGHKYSWGNEIVEGTLNDQIAIGDVETMNIYADLYNHMDTIPELDPRNSDFVYISPETALNKFLLRNNIEIVRMDFNMEIVRNY